MRQKRKCPIGRDTKKANQKPVYQMFSDDSDKSDYSDSSTPQTLQKNAQIVINFPCNIGQMPLGGRLLLERRSCHCRASAFGTIWHGKSWATRREVGILGESCQKSKYPFQFGTIFWQKIDCPADAEQSTKLCTMHYAFYNYLTKTFAVEPSVQRTMLTWPRSGLSKRTPCKL